MLRNTWKTLAVFSGAGGVDTIDKYTSVSAKSIKGLLWGKRACTYEARFDGGSRGHVERVGLIFLLINSGRNCVVSGWGLNARPRPWRAVALWRAWRSQHSVPGKGLLWVASLPSTCSPHLTIPKIFTPLHPWSPGAPSPDGLTMPGTPRVKAANTPLPFLLLPTSRSIKRHCFPLNKVMVPWNLIQGGCTPIFPLT